MKVSVTIYAVFFFLFFSLSFGQNVSIDRQVELIENGVNILFWSKWMSNSINYTALTVSSECLTDLNATAKGIQSRQLWAQKRNQLVFVYYHLFIYILLKLFIIKFTMPALDHSAAFGPKHTYFLATLINVCRCDIWTCKANMHCWNCAHLGPNRHHLNHH